MSTDYVSRYDGPEYGPETEPEDAAKYRTVMLMVLGLMRDMVWRSSAEICTALGLNPMVRVDSRLRDLRKDQYAKFIKEQTHLRVLAVKCKRFDGGIYRYQVITEPAS